MNEEVYFQNADILLMDPCYSREGGDDEDFELYCSNLVIDTFADGYYHVIKGSYEENVGKIDVIAENPEGYSIGLFSVDSGRVGVYAYREAVKEQPKLKERIERGEIIAAIIKHFSGTISYLYNEGEVYILGKSDNRKNDFFTFVF